MRTNTTAANTAAFAHRTGQPLGHRGDARADHARRVLAGDQEHAEDGDRELCDVHPREREVEAVLVAVGLLERTRDGSSGTEITTATSSGSPIGEHDGDEQRPARRAQRPELRPLRERDARLRDAARRARAAGRSGRARQRGHAATPVDVAPRGPELDLAARELHERLLERRLERRQLDEQDPLLERRPPRSAPRSGRSPRARRAPGWSPTRRPGQELAQPRRLRCPNANEIPARLSGRRRRRSRRRSGVRVRSRSGGRRSAPSRSSGATRRTPSAPRRRGPCSRFRIQRIPSGSSPLTGSSSSSVEGSPSSAAAMPSRCPIPSENWPARFLATACSPTRSMSSSTRRLPMPCVCASASRWLYADLPLCTDRASSTAPTSCNGAPELPVALAVHGHGARGRSVETEDHTHRRRLARPVRPEEAGHDPRAYRERQIVDCACRAVLLRQPARLDHRRTVARATA